MEECTFTPNGVQDRNGARGPSRNKFYKEGEQFLKKKDAFISQQNAMRDMELEMQRRSARLISDNSRKILEQKNYGSRSFLERNY